jgi:VCBS repeat-containing protein
MSKNFFDRLTEKEARRVGVRLGANGTQHNDLIIGKLSGDNINGKAGNDWIFSLTGNDVVDGGAGSDFVSAGSGQDTAVYKLAENKSSLDVYDGGGGTDTLRLVFTAAEWQRTDIKADVLKYLDFLKTASAARAGIFKFDAFGLIVRDFERLEVYVDGILVDPTGNRPVDARDDAFASQGEDAVVIGNVLTNDSVPDVPASVALVVAPQRGTLDLESNGDFTFNPGSDFDFLSAGEAAIVSFTYRVSDRDGDSATAVATITIKGTNDAPVAGAPAASNINERAGQGGSNQPLLADGSVGFSDVDLADVGFAATVLGVQATGATAGLPPNADLLSFLSLPATTKLAGSSTGSVSWTFAAADRVFDYLAQDRSVVLTYAIAINDGDGGEAQTTITVTVTGSNDGPVITAAIDQGSVEAGGASSAIGTRSLARQTFPSPWTGSPSRAMDRPSSRTSSTTASLRRTARVARLRTSSVALQLKSAGVCC